MTCDKCGTELHVGDWPMCGGDPAKHVPSKPMVIGDDLPGGYWVKHGLCNPDGSPRRYDSKTEIKREANRRGYTLVGDTPKPYRVNWEGKPEKRS